MPRLGRGESQVARAQFGQLLAGPQPRQRQRRVSTPGQHQVQAGRQVLQHEPERRMDLPVIDQVIVVEDQQHPAVSRLGG